jgi:hypothetical protein
LERSLLTHILAFVYLCAVVSLILSCYREESLPRILRETLRRSVKFVAFIGALAIVTLVYQKIAVDA